MARVGDLSAKYCNVCGARLVPDKIKSQYNTMTGEKEIINIGLHCPTDLCEHFGIKHDYESVKQNWFVAIFSNVVVRNCRKCGAAVAVRLSGYSPL